ncbi:MAG TPA: hypothetical protein VG838_09710 [Opitutaceae bacterium]|nr:hypothetical protein [Opitutaceae bacterium]
MEPLDHENGPPPEEHTSSPFQKKWRRRRAKVSDTFELRNLWWRLLDAWDEHRLFRLALYAGLALVLVGGGSWAWLYPWWTRRNAISIAQQWIATGRLDYASEIVKQALANSPERPEVWQLAAEVARRARKPAEAMYYSHYASTLEPDNPAYALDWATDALGADQPDTAERALAGLPATARAESSRALRLTGEIARRRVQLTAARDAFAAALRLDGPVAIDEVPLGGILIYSRDTAERQHGLRLLSKWTADPEWGATALRILLGDALDHDDRAAMLKWAEALRAHPRCTLADIPNCLLGISRADQTRFAEVLAVMEKQYAVNPTQIAQLIGWLNQVGHSADAVQWIQRLPSGMTGNPAVVVVAAEAFRQSSDWPGLGAWVSKGTWGRDVEFLHLAYSMLAARQLGDVTRADELWRTLQSDAQATGAHALFAADTLYTWGWQKEALALLWMATDQSGVALEALGTLARHYQVRRDADGQYQVFRRLHALRSKDASIANNFAFFAALTGSDLPAAEQAAHDNHVRAPANVGYLATYAFTLSAQNRTNEALALLTPVASEWKQSSGLAFAYGLALAGAGRKDEARPILASLDLATLSLREEQLVKAASN